MLLQPKIATAEWIAQRTMKVTFTSPLSGHLYQLYAGRDLVAETQDPSQRELIAQILPATLPQHLAILAVTPAEAGTEYGGMLPGARPYNRVRLTFSTSAWPADSERIEITAGTTPGGAVDADNLLGSLLFVEDGEYEFETEPLETGTWNFEITGYDDKDTNGNAGTAETAAATVASYPQDVQLVDDARLTVSSGSGNLTIGWNNS